MNASSNQTTDQPIHLDDLFYAFGQTLLLNGLNFYPFVIFGSFGFILNIFSFIIFQQTEFNTPLYQYLKVYSINSAQVCFFATFVFLANTQVMFEWSNSYWTHVYYLHVFVPFANTGYFYGTVLDILITLDRIANFNKLVKKLISKSVYRICIASLVCCIAINFVYFFAFKPASLTTNVKVRPKNTIQEFTLWYPGLTDFSISYIGKISLFVLYSFRDIFMMIAEIVVNIVSIYYLKNYLSRKNKLVSHATRGNALSLDATGVHSIDGSYHSSRGIKRKLKTKSTKKEANNVEDHVSKAELNASVMVILICILSLCEHILVIACIIYPLYNPPGMVFNFLAIFGNFSVTFKHSLNFLIFFVFNKNFKKECMKYIRFK
jgi:hypothetical protein